MTRVWCNGQWLDPLDFQAAPTDRGLMHGFGLFETILALRGRPVFADLHLARLASGCDRLRWHVPSHDLRGIMAELLAANDLAAERARIRLAITAGSGTLQDLAPGEDRLIWMTASPVAEPPACTSANLSPWTRNERSPLAGLKCASYAENVLALGHAASLGFEETIFLNTAGQVCEAATSNVFIVRDGVVKTPPLDSGCLPGIARGIALGLATGHGLVCEEIHLGETDLLAADEIFLTSSIRGVMGISRFLDQKLAVGPVTTDLRRAWQMEVESGKAF